MKAIENMQNILHSNLDKKEGGIFSVCCSNTEVLEALLVSAKQKHYPVVIESTSNQVNQYGGYTGMKPEDYVRHVYTIADEVGYPKERIILGGDHLGPNAWQGEASETAMDKSCELVKTYIQAGYRKIHLDASMACADDNFVTEFSIGDELVAHRAARMCEVAEKTWQALEKKGEAPVYVIGTEVPSPGGNVVNNESIEPTRVDAAQRTYTITKQTFINTGLASVWPRVIAMVVQPGVEFSDDTICAYNAAKTKPLSNLCKSFGLVYEAHSTDYQKSRSLKELVQNHYAILKVGPWLSYAYREALINLAHIEQTMIEYKLLDAHPSNFVMQISNYVQDNPQYWEKYYHGDADNIRYKCLFSLSDRIRYYWNTKKMQSYVSLLLTNLADTILPVSLVSQYFPNAVALLEPKQMTAKHLVQFHIKSVLLLYEEAIAHHEA